jgi:Carboxypeptidase regulatory-like domain/TonB dependent receptor
MKYRNQVEKDSSTQLKTILVPMFCVAVLLGFFAGDAGIQIAQAQTITASVQGLIQDSSGAVVPGASVRAVNTSTGVATEVTSDVGGRYVFASLQPGGPYTLTIETKGFKTEIRAGIQLAVNQVADVPITLQVGAATQNVEVTADASQLETSTAAIGQVIGNRDVENLPLNQRNVYSLVFLIPGVTGTVSDQYNGSSISVNGGLPGTTSVLVDGIPASPPLVNPIAGFAVFPSVDAVQEFKVEATNYSAEFGRSGSGIVNVILKSGGNQVHGSLYEFLRNSDLDSNTYFANASHTPLPHFERSQFGGSFSGPVEFPKLYNGKDKTFFLFSYEGLRQGTASEETDTVPTVLERSGDFSQTYDSSCKPVVIYDPATTTASGSGYVRQPFRNDKIPANRIDPVAARILNYYPLPNRPGEGCAGTDNYFATGVSKENTDTFDSRVDEVFNDRNRMFVRYSRRNLHQLPTVLFPAAQQVAQGGKSQAQISNSTSIDYTFTPNPNLVIEIPVGFSRTLLNFVPVSAGFNPSTELGFPSYIAANADHLLFPGINPESYRTLGDAGQGQTTHAAFDIYTVGANLTKVMGAQVIKFGGLGWLLQVNDTESGSSTGNYSFSPALTQGPNPNVATAMAGNSIASMLLGLGSGTMEIDSKNAATTSRYYAAYIQDDWRALSRLTLNLGLRYDLEIPRTERHNRMETFDPTIASPLAAQTGIAGLAGGVVYSGANGATRRQFNPQWHNLDPRVGFSYQLNGNTELRGAYGIYYGPSQRAAAGTVGNEGFSAVTTYTGSANGLTPSVYLSNPFPNGLNEPIGNSLGLLTGIGSSFESPVTGDNKVGYAQIWHLDIQRQLPFNLLIDAAYVGSHGVHLPKSGENDWNGNQLTPATLALGSQLQKSVPNPFYGIIKNGPESGATIPLSYLDAPFPQFTAIQESYLTGGSTEYNSFQLKVNKRLSHNLSALVAFTGQKLTDDYGGGIQNIYNPKAERAVSSNDISRRLVVSAVYSLPFGHGQTIGSNWNRALDLAMGGWQLNGIATESDGSPLQVYTQNTSQSGSGVLRPNLTGISPATSGSVKSRLNDYLNPAAFSQPAPFTFGDAPRTLPDARTPGTHDIDFSLFKNFQATEKLNVQFRVESFNLLNQVVFGGPNTQLTSGQFGKITSQANTPRQVQAALKILF